MEDVQPDNVQPLSKDTTEIFTTEEVFHTRNETIGWATARGKQYNVVVVIWKSQNSKGNRVARLELACECSDVFRSHKKVGEENKRNTATRKCGCPFKLRCVFQRGSVDSWKIDVVNGVHNHPLAKTLKGHAFATRLTVPKFEYLSEMTQKGDKPKQVLNSIKNRYSDNQSSIKQVYNAKHKVRTLDMNGRTQI